MSSTVEKWYQFDVTVKAGGGRQFRRPVAASDLASAQEQARFAADRHGKLPDDEYEVPVTEIPQFAANSGSRITGLTMSVGRGEDAFCQWFDVTLFEPMAQQHTAELLKSGQLSAQDETHFEVSAREVPRRNSARVRRRSLSIGRASFSNLRQMSVACGAGNERDFDVFVLADALQQMEELTFRRAGNEQAVWLIGRLLRDTTTADLGVLIHTVIEARGLRMDRFSIDFSAETYADIDAQLIRRRKRPGCEGDRKVGLMHTHPFLPSVVDGKEACPQCPLQADCQLTSAFFSDRDAAFHRSVFGRTAYAVQFVLGLTPREERDLRMFCLDGGIFRERGYYRLSDVPDSATSTKE